MELDQLRNFLKVAELANFTRAAEAVGLSQPALSRSVARLEEELGQPLLERGSRSITLTEAGKLLRVRATQVVAILDDAKAEIRDDGRTGLVRVGAIPTIAPYLLPSYLAAFRHSFPAATVQVLEETTDNLLRSLADGEVDVGILARPVEAKHLQFHDMFEEELLLVMASGHPLASKRQIRAADIESLSFVLLGDTHCLTGNVMSFCRQRAFDPLSVERTSQLATVQELVSLGHGVSLIPEMACRVDTNDRRVYRRLAGPRPTRRIVLANNPYRFQSRLVKQFAEGLLAASVPSEAFS